MKIIVNCISELEFAATSLIELIDHNNIVCFYGEMGVGKTTFIRYLINCLQKRNNLRITEVTSPTFNLLSEYNIIRTSRGGKRNTS